MPAHRLICETCKHNDVIPAGDTGWICVPCGRYERQCTCSGVVRKPSRASERFDERAARRRAHREQEQ